MKSLNLAHPMLLVMVGVPGAGKSFFARQFAKAHGLPCVSADRLRFELFNEPQFSPAEQEVVGRVASYMTGELLASGASFILDTQLANVRAQRLALERRAHEHDYKTLVIWVQVDDGTAEARSGKRTAGKRDDQYNRAMPKPAFVALKKQLTPPTTEPHVVISGKHTFSAQHKTVLRKLQPVERGVQPPVQNTQNVITPTPTRRMSQPAARPENRRITIH